MTRMELGQRRSSREIAGTMPLYREAGTRATAVSVVPAEWVDKELVLEACRVIRRKPVRRAKR